MTDATATLPPTADAAALAAAAGVADLAAALEIEDAEGEGLHTLLARHEIALGHRLAMQFAAAGNAALDTALAADADAASVQAADRMAARLGGTTARLMGNVRLSLLSRAARPAAYGEEWIGVCFQDEKLCTPAEAERRLAAAKTARAAARGVFDSAAGRMDTPAPAALERLAVGRTAAADLAAEAGLPALAATAAGEGKLFLRHELAAAHRLVMRFGGRAGRLLETRANDDRTEALRLAAAAARLMVRGRQALAALPRLGTDPDGGSRAVAGYYWIGERDMFANANVSANATVGAPPCGRPAATAEPSSSAPAIGRPRGAAPTVVRRGTLKNGNPSGDYMTAPRCGACTRAGGRCRQPAMKNGRCRFHGGKSTGPRTAAGLAASRVARRTHGGHSAEIVELRKAAAAHARRVKTLVALDGRMSEGGRRYLRLDPSVVAFRRLNPAGHGVHPLFFMTSPQKRKAG